MAHWRHIDRRIEQLYVAEGMEIDHRAVLEASPDAIFVVDRAGKIRFANARAEVLLGYSQAEFATIIDEQPLLEAFRRGYAAHRACYFVDPASRPLGEGMIAVTRDGREIPIDFAVSILGEGERALAVCSIRDNARREKDEEGVRRNFETLRDHVAECEAEVRVSREHLALFVKHAPAAVVMLDSQMRYLLVSDRRLGSGGPGPHQRRLHPG